VPAGEIGDVADLTKGVVEGRGFDMIVAAIGEVDGEKAISGRNIKPGDAIIGLRSSGIHSNGISLARKILFKQWGGKYDSHDVPDGLNREVVFETLEPTGIYVKPFLKVVEELKVKGAVHITGDAYSKFERLATFSSGIGFEFDNFKPHPIFGVIQRTASELGGTIADEEMFKTFNMGWGFAIIVSKTSTDKALNILDKAKVQAEQIGRITDSEGVKILHEGKKIILA
jgi:phosphoribosylformylglycinamidine cyclo-ligase